MSNTDKAVVVDGITTHSGSFALDHTYPGGVAGFAALVQHEMAPGTGTA